MSAQTSISNDPAVAYEGMQAGGALRDRISKLSQVDMVAGRFVIQGTADDQCNYPAATGDVTGPNLLGVSLFDPSKPTNWPPTVGAVAYPAGQAVPILRKGRVWVKVEENVTPASPVFVRFTANGNGPLGSCRASADTATAVQIPNGSARFMTTALAGALVEVEINLP